ncbi:hypothetical protein SI65_06754 [Aspergillus cristatus]|uniref:DUF985 domain-containing protein n=1 Tax=Aspergillus cristatus TaxID=573508 RepID=A0A1E3BC47_ASPCR|nr:hypothetical protein SI65_06754 [Aspergillus cristatus]
MTTPLAQIKPTYPPNTPDASSESPTIQSTIKTLNLQPHIEGGYFVETDRDTLRVPNPHPPRSKNDTTRSASTSIYYLLTPRSPLGAFHRNASRTVHTLHRGRGMYVILHADEESVRRNGGKAAVETFVVGQDIEKGERLQWVVEGGKYKGTFLLPDDGGSSNGLLISETVVPGFEFVDHDFLRAEKMDELLTPDQVQELNWMLRKTN